MSEAVPSGVASGVKRAARLRLRGLENLLVPSFTPDLRALDEPGIRLDVRQSIRHGCCATALALEARLSRAEQQRFMRIACDEAQGRIAVGIVLSAPVRSEAVELLSCAAQAGISHVHLGVPQGFAPRSDAELVGYLSSILEAAPLPVLLLGERLAFPQLHASGLPIEAIEQLADQPSIIGLDLPSLDSGLIAECCERFGERLLVSSPHLGLLPMLVQNFNVQLSGPWGVEGLQSPAQRHAVSFFEMLLGGRASEAMTLYWRLAPALGAMARVAASFAHTGAQHWPLLKYQQWLSGGNGGLTRQPVMRLFQRDMQLVRGALAAVGVSCAQPDAAFFAGRQGREPSA